MEEGKRRFRKEVGAGRAAAGSQEEQLIHALLSSPSLEQRGSLQTGRP